MSLFCTYVDHGEGGPPSCMHLAERPMPVPGAGEVLIEVAYAGVNRPDLFQREGSYPPPPNASPYLGLEVSGRIVAVGEAVRQRRVGERVCALTPGGGYARYCLADARHCLVLPDSIDDKQGAAIPETTFTVWTNVFERAALKSGESFLVHGGTSGIGMTAISLAHAFGATVWTTVGSPQKAQACREAGADHVVLYHDEDFEQKIREQTKKRGVDVILDMVGGDYVNKNLRSLATDGRLVQIAFLQGSKVEIDALPIMIRRLRFTGSTLRARSDDDKAAIALAVQANVIPLMAEGKCLPRIHAVFDLAQAAQAHELMQSSAHIGKILLKVGG